MGNLYRYDNDAFGQKTSSAIIMYLNVQNKKKRALGSLFTIIFVSSITAIQSIVEQSRILRWLESPLRQHLAS